MQPAGLLQGREARLRQIEKIAASPVLHNSESLCNLLRYLARQSMDQPGVPVKEYQIATELFGRPTDFDPRLDSSVRVQTGRLRTKLAEYYAGPGAADAIIVEVPKGSYSLVLHEREPQPPSAPVGARRSLPRLWWAIPAVLAVAVLLVVFALRAARSGAPRPEALQVFWKPFLDGQEAPLVVYSNAAFVGRPDSGLRYFDPSSDSPGAVLDHYTGVGEVMAIHSLDRVFSGFQRFLRVKRGRLLTWDDAKTSDLIFLGSTSENLSLRELPGPREFVFRVRDAEPRRGDLAIVNLHPRPGEQPFYLASASLPIREDYALVGLLPGLNSGRHVLVLAGTTTFGTQAAAEFVCEPANVQGLLSRIEAARASGPAAFEAVVRVRVSGGVPVQSDVVALRVR